MPLFSYIIVKFKFSRNMKKETLSWKIKDENDINFLIFFLNFKVHNSKILEDNFLMPSSGLSWWLVFQVEPGVQYISQC